jgi:hypothetical protein
MIAMKTSSAVFRFWGKASLLEQARIPVLCLPKIS